MASERIILGVDPGTNIMGYGIISTIGNKAELLTLGVLKLNKTEDHALRLRNIFEHICTLIGQYHPDELAIEAPFYGKNVQSMLKLGRAQGVAIAAALSKSLPVFEYSPRKIKQSITGKGSASKEQVSLMLQRILKFEEMPKYLDATDGLAVAMCHFFQKGIVPGSSNATVLSTNKPVKKGKNYSGWKAFLSENPDRISDL